MNLLVRQSKMIAFVLTLAVLFQSCRAYNYHSVSLQEAAKDGRRVKIKTKENKVLKFKKVVYEDEQFYGLKKKNAKVLIDPENVKKVRMHNKTMSIIQTIGVGFLGSVIVYAVCCWTPSIGVGAISF